MCISFFSFLLNTTVFCVEHFGITKAHYTAHKLAAKKKSCTDKDKVGKGKKKADSCKNSFQCSIYLMSLFFNGFCVIQC